MAKALRQRVGNQYTGTQRTRNAVHGECTVELAKWTLPIISLCREPYEAKVSRTGLTGGMGRRTVRQRALCLPSKATHTRRRTGGEGPEPAARPDQRSPANAQAVHGEGPVELAKGAGTLRVRTEKDH